jgi:hypothetical protein
MSEATIALKVKPWMVPNFVSIEMPPRPKQDGIAALPSIPLKDLPLETLDSLAEQWRTELYAKAGKPLPEDRK